MLKPTSYLTFVLSAQDATSENASAIKRAYSYIAPTKIVADVVAGQPVPGAIGEDGGTGADDGEPDGAIAPSANAIAMEVRLPGHPLWEAGEKNQDETWEQLVMPWLKTKLETLFGTVSEFNNPQRRSFTRRIDYGRLDLVLAGRRVSFGLEPDSSLRDVLGPLANIRAWLAGLPAGKEVDGVFVPSDHARGDADWFEATLTDGTTLRVDGAAPVV